MHPAYTKVVYPKVQNQRVIALPICFTHDCAIKLQFTMHVVQKNVIKRNFLILEIADLNAINMYRSRFIIRFKTIYWFSFFHLLSSPNLPVICIRKATTLGLTIDVAVVNLFSSNTIYWTQKVIIRYIRFTYKFIPWREEEKYKYCGSEPKESFTNHVSVR